MHHGRHIYTLKTRLVTRQHHGWGRQVSATHGHSPTLGVVSPLQPATGTPTLQGGGKECMPDDWGRVDDRVLSTPSHTSCPCWGSRRAPPSFPPHPDPSLTPRFLPGGAHAYANVVRHLECRANPSGGADPRGREGEKWVHADTADRRDGARAGGSAVVTGR